MTSASKTEQELFWQSQFGKDYLERNSFDPKALDAVYSQTYGVSRQEMNARFLTGLSLDSILEIGCNTGNQLRLLTLMGFTNLWGIELFHDAATIARKYSPTANIVTGSALDLPFKDGLFEMVFTSGVLIHIHPDDLPIAMGEMFRTSKKYIFGFEYYSQVPESVNYRGHENRLWKLDYPSLFLDQFPGKLKLVKKEIFPYLNNENEDIMYLLEKIT